MCKAAKVSIVEVEEIVECGQIESDNVHVPGIFVDRIVQGKNYEKRIAKVVTTQDDPLESNGDANENAMRMTIAKRAAMEFKDGMYGMQICSSLSAFSLSLNYAGLFTANLGVGIPNLCLRFLPENVKVTLQSENGVLGLVNCLKSKITVLQYFALFRDHILNRMKWILIWSTRVKRQQQRCLAQHSFRAMKVLQ